MPNATTWATKIVKTHVLTDVFKIKLFVSIAQRKTARMKATTSAKILVTKIAYKMLTNVLRVKHVNSHRNLLVMLQAATHNVA
jgi:hypothetical protein